MKELTKFILISIMVFISQKSFSQRFYVKCQSDKIKISRICHVYLSGFSNGNVYSESIQIPSKSFWQLRCDSTTSVSLSLDCFRMQVFTLDERFNNGDSVILDVDNRTAIIINKRK
jgi:hypothetical protein